MLDIVIFADAMDFHEVLSGSVAVECAMLNSLGEIRECIQQGKKCTHFVRRHGRQTILAPWL